MGREGHETTVVCSSIALLQERFRQLQRVKEMREERELRMLSEPNNNKQFNNLSPTTNVYEPSRLFSRPDLIFPQRSTSQQVSLSLWPTFQTSFEDHYYCSSFETPVFMNLWYFDTSISPLEASSNKFQGFDDSHETDVDTSLHL